MPQIPKVATDFLALAELIRNPSKVDEICKIINGRTAALKEQNDQAQSIADEVKRNAKLLEDIEQSKKELAVDIDKLAQNKAKLAVLQSQLDQFNGAITDRELRVEAREVDIASREDALNRRDDALSDREADVMRKERELDDALKAATAEYDKWNQKIGQMKSLAGN